MAVTSNADQLARNMVRRAQNLERSNRVATRKAGQHVREAIEVEARRATGGDMRLSGLRNRAIAVRMKIGTTPDSAELKASGAWPLIENPIRAHRIPRSRARRRKVLRIPGIGWRAYANHPGVRRSGGPWKKASNRSLPQVQRIYRDAVRDVLR